MSFNEVLKYIQMNFKEFLKYIQTNIKYFILAAFIGFIIIFIVDVSFMNKIFIFEDYKTTYKPIMKIFVFIIPALICGIFLKNNYITNFSKYIEYNPINILLCCGLLIFICYYIVPIYLFNIEPSYDILNWKYELSFIIPGIICVYLIYRNISDYVKKNEVNHFNNNILLILYILLTIIANLVF